MYDQLFILEKLKVDLVDVRVRSERGGSIGQIQGNNMFFKLKEINA